MPFPIRSNRKTFWFEFQSVFFALQCDQVLEGNLYVLLCLGHAIQSESDHVDSSLVTLKDCRMFFCLDDSSCGELMRAKLNGRK